MPTLLIYFLVVVLSATSFAESARDFTSRLPGHTIVIGPITAYTVESGESVAVAYLANESGYLVLASIRNDELFTKKLGKASSVLPGIKRFLDKNQVRRAVEAKGITSDEFRLMYCGADNTVACVDCHNFGILFWCCADSEGTEYLIPDNLRVIRRTTFVAGAECIPCTTKGNQPAKESAPKGDDEQ